VGNIISEVTFLLQRMNWLSIIDIALVTLVVFFLLRLVRGTQAVVLLRGIILLLIVIVALTSVLDLPAFSWLLTTTLPTILISLPVIFAPEIRRALEKLGRAGVLFSPDSEPDEIERMIEIICTSAKRLADRRYGALIVIERSDHLDEYLDTGVKLDSMLSTEMVLQIFYINTPLHDGAAILRGNRIRAAGCVMPLSASGTLSRSPDREMGLRHRAALGISEVSDAVSVVVSEETGSISVTHNGRMIRRLDQPRLKNILLAFFQPRVLSRLPKWIEPIVRFLQSPQRRTSKES